MATVFSAPTLACETEKTYHVTLKKLEQKQPGCLPLQFEFPRRIGHNDKASVVLVIHENGEYKYKESIPISPSPDPESETLTSTFCLPEEQLPTLNLSVSWSYYDEKTGMMGMCSDSMATGSLSELLAAGGSMTFTPFSM